MTNTTNTTNDYTTASEELLTTQQVADKYSVSPMTVLRWVYDGLPCLWPSERTRRFDPLEVDRWVQKRTKARLRRT